MLVYHYQKMCRTKIECFSDQRGRAFGVLIELYLQEEVQERAIPSAKMSEPAEMMKDDSIFSAYKETAKTASTAFWVIFGLLLGSLLCCCLAGIGMLFFSKKAYDRMERRQDQKEEARRNRGPPPTPAFYALPTGPNAYPGPTQPQYAYSPYANAPPNPQ